VRLTPVHRFYFHLHECGTTTPDEEGRELPSFEIAIKEAVIAARSIMASEVTSGRLSLGCHIEITDSNGISLAVIPFKEVLLVSRPEGNSCL
jgi:hypothetical protein